MSFITKRIKAFTYAFQGLASAIKKEDAFKVHLAACVLVTVIGIYFGITKTECCIIVICCALVIVSELINTALERLCNTLMPEKNENVKFIKDVSAGAVLIVAIASIIIAIIIFLPYLKIFFANN